MTIACPDCGTLQELPRLRRGDIAACPRCRGHLERFSARSVNVSLACAIAAWLLLFPANLLQLMHLRLAGRILPMHLASGVVVLASNGWLLIAVLVGASAVVLPFIRYGLLIASLGSVRLGYCPSWRGPAFRWAILLDRWTMPEVFLIACIISYARVQAQASIAYVDAGGYCFLAAALLAMLSRALLDRRTVWRALAPEREAPLDTPVISCTICDLVLPASEEGHRCPRCGQKLAARLPGVRSRTLALLIAALLLYLPANMFPMSVTIYPGHVKPYTIVDGVMALFGAGLWPLGVMVSCTSIGIPVAKIFGLGWCLLSIHRRSKRLLVLKTRMYRVIDESGRWSSVDPFIISVIVPLIHYRDLLITAAGGAATAFIAVVLLTMLASRTFDPRLMWDAALERDRLTPEGRGAASRRASAAPLSALERGHARA